MVEVTDGLLLEVVGERVREYQAATYRVQGALHHVARLSGGEFAASALLAVKDERAEDGTVRRYVVEVERAQPVEPDAAYDLLHSEAEAPTGAEEPEA